MNAETARQERGVGWLALVVLVLAPFLVYANTLDNAYQLDDQYRIQDNRELEQVWPPWRHFLDAKTSATLPSLVQYRPLLPLVLSLDFALSDALGVERRTALHFWNIALHTLTCLLLYRLARELLGFGERPALAEPLRSRAAFACAFLFAVHPVAGVPVNYLCSRDLLLMHLFLVSALLVYVRMRSRGGGIGSWVAFSLLLVLSLLSKKNSVVAPGLVLAFELLLGAGPRSRLTWLRTLPPLVVCLAVLGWIRFVLGFSDLDQLQLEGRWAYALEESKVHLFYYMRNVVWPFRMRARPHIEPVESLADPLALAGFLFVLGSLVAAWFLRKRGPLLSFCILAYWLLLALTSSVIPLRSAATDYRQVPSLFFLMLFASTLLHSRLGARAVRTTIAVSALWFALTSVAMNRHWQDGRSLWAQSLRYGGTPLAHLNYGFSVVNTDPELAEHHYHEVLRVQPGNVWTLINLGLLEIDTGRPEGIRRIELAVQNAPQWAVTHHWLGNGYERLGRLTDGLRESETAANLEPHVPSYGEQADRQRSLHAFAQPLHARATSLQVEGKAAESLAPLRELHSRVFCFEDSLFLEGFALQSAGEIETSVERYTRFLRIRPDHAQAWFNLAYARMTLGSHAEAVPDFEQALELRPTYREVHLHLATCHRALGNADEAARQQALYEAD